MEVAHLLATIEHEMLGGYKPPLSLLRKMDPQLPLDKEILGYVLNGGEAGGYYHWLALLTRTMRPHRILELGNRYGVSTIMIYSELSQDSQLISVDILRDQRYVPKDMWQDPRVRFVFGDCLDLAIYGDDIPIDVDVFWTDTVHSYQQIKDEFDVYEPLLADEAVVIVDDIRLSDKGRFFSEVPYAKHDLTDLCHVSGFGVLHYVRHPSKYASLETRLSQAVLASAKIWKRRHDELLLKLQEVQQARENPSSRRKNPPLTKLKRLARPLSPVYRSIVSWLHVANKE